MTIESQHSSMSIGYALNDGSKMMRVKISALSLLVLLCGCQQAPEPRATADTGLNSGVMRTGAKELTMAENGETLTLKVGQSLDLALPGEPSTGYNWEVVRTPGSLLKPAAQRIEADSATRVCKMQRLQFAATEQGRGMLTLAYRSHDKIEDSANFYTLYLRVVP